MKVDIDYKKICNELSGHLFEGKILTSDKAIQIRAAVEAKFYEPQKVAKKLSKEIFASQTGVGVSTNFERISSQAFTIFNEGPWYDNFYERAFREVQVENGRWDIHTVTDGITISQVPEGHRLRLKSMESGRQTVYTAKYGGGVQWTDEMIRHREIARMQDTMERMRNRYWRYKADQHYGLIAAAAPADNSNSNVTTYNAVANNTQVTRDIDTIDAAAYTLGNRNLEKDYNMGPMLLYMPMSLRKRINRAFRISAIGDVVSNSQLAGTVLDKIEYDVIPIYTWNTQLPTDAGIMVLPGNKVQRADEVSPFMLSDQDILSLQYVLALWSYYGAAVGDTGQFQRVNFS